MGFEFLPRSGGFGRQDRAQKLASLVKRAEGSTVVVVRLSLFVCLFPFVIFIPRLLNLSSLSCTIALMNPQDPSQDAAQHQQPSPAATAPEQVPTASDPAETTTPPAQDPERPLYHTEDQSSTATHDATDSPRYAEGLPAAPQPQPHPHHTGTVEWSASEFIAHDKDMQWYAVLALVTSVVAIVAYFITRDRFSIMVVLVAGMLFGVAGSRPPRQMHYTVDDHGVSIGSKAYPYSDFRSFSVLHEGPLKSITFMPLKRFMPPLSMYYDPADEDKIAEVLAAHLPMQDHPNDPVDKLMKWVRF